MAQETLIEMVKKDKNLADVIRLATLGLAGWDAKNATVLTPVIDALSQPPGGSIALNARYLVLGVGSGDWTGMDNRVVTFGAPGWTADPANTAGDIVLATDPSDVYTFTGTEWILFSESQGAPISDDIPQPVQFDVESPGVIAETSRGDHVHKLADPAVSPTTISADAMVDVGTDSTGARADHQHAISVGANVPQAGAATGNAGSAQSFSRSDHRHGHGQIPGGTFHAEATTSLAGFMSPEQFDKVDALQQPAIGRYTLGADQTGLTGNDDIPLAIFVDDFVDAGLGLNRIGAIELQAVATQRYQINVQLELIRSAGSGHQTLIIGAKVLDAAGFTNIRKLEALAPYTNTFVGGSYNFSGVITLATNEKLTITVGNMTASDTFTAKLNGCWVDIKKI